MDPFGACNDDSPAVEERLPQAINARAGELDPAQVRSPVPEVRRDARCDDNLRLAEQGRNVETITTSVQAFGGYCDCEVLANVTPDKFGWPD